MILIVSEKFDVTTNIVISWLETYEVGWIRINDIECLNKCLYINPGNEDADIYFKLEDDLIELSKIRSVWYRRTPDMSIKNQILNMEGTIFSDFNLKINESLKIEFPALFSFIFYKGKYKILGSPYYTSLNKLVQLAVASKLGLKIPYSIVSTEKRDVTNLINIYGKIITKPISNISDFKIENKEYVTYTTMIDLENINMLPQEFAPSLFQEYIDKEFEIRTFFIEDKCYSMAMFTQKDQQTKIDFRMYNDKEPTRRIPFKLPIDIEKKIIELMNKFKLNTGSIDLIYSSKGEYVFLEINPVGQFGMVSYPCNYYLEKIVAQKLIEYEY